MLIIFKIIINHLSFYIVIVIHSLLFKNLNLINFEADDNKCFIRKSFI